MTDLEWHIRHLKNFSKCNTSPTYESLVRKSASEVLKAIDLCAKTLDFYSKGIKQGGCWSETKMCVCTREDVDDDTTWSKFSPGKRARQTLKEIGFQDDEDN